MGPRPGTMSSKTLSVSIRRDPKSVYEFVANPENLPKWAKGLGRSVKRSGDGWVAETPQGPVKIRFAAKNDLGVLDHWVSLSTGIMVYVPMRVVPNISGTEVLLTLFRTGEMTDDAYARDAELVERDLSNLKRLLER